MASALAAGAVIGFFVVFAIVGAALLIAGTSTGIALGVAGFVASCGGLGFGGTMFGANWYVHRSGEPH